MCEQLVSQTIENAAHRRFIKEYVIHLNGTQAYMTTYPDCSYDAARVGATRLIAKPNIKAEIARQLELLGMTKSELVAHLAKIVRTSMDDFIVVGVDGSATVSIERAKERHAMGEIKRFTQRRRIVRSNDEETVIEERSTIELHDKLSAIDKLARHMGLYTDNPVTIDVHNIDVKALTDEELDRLIDGASK